MYPVLVLTCKVRGILWSSEGLDASRAESVLAGESVEAIGYKKVERKG